MENADTSARETETNSVLGTCTALQTADVGEDCPAEDSAACLEHRDQDLGAGSTVSGDKKGSEDDVYLTKHSYPEVSITSSPSSRSEQQPETTATPHLHAPQTQTPELPDAPHSPSTTKESTGADVTISSPLTRALADAPTPSDVHTSAGPCPTPQAITAVALDRTLEGLSNTPDSTSKESPDPTPGADAGAGLPYPALPEHLFSSNFPVSDTIPNWDAFPTEKATPNHKRGIPPSTTAMDSGAANTTAQAVLPPKPTTAQSKCTDRRQGSTHVHGVSHGGVTASSGDAPGVLSPPVLKVIDVGHPFLLPGSLPVCCCFLLLLAL
jgi:hypothetical protein